MDINQYVGAFLAETEDNLSALSNLCLVLEEHGANDDTFAAMFRAAHTLKGMSATMGYSKMALLTHHMEDALSYVRSHTETFQPGVVDTLFQAIDALTNHLESIRDNACEADTRHDEIVAQLARISDQPSAASLIQPTSIGLDDVTLNMLMNLDAEGHTVGVVELILDPSCVMKGVRMVMVMRSLEEFGDCMGSSPDSVTLENGDFEGAVELAIVLHRGSFDQLVLALNDITEVASVQMVDWHSRIHVQPTVLSSSAGEVDVAERPEIALAREESPMSPEESVAATVGPARPREQSLRVPVGRIDEFMNVVSELVIAKTRLDLLSRTHLDPSLRDVSEHIARLTESLQEGVMNMRMMPVESLFQRFPRMMRDLQKSLGREFDFQMTGLETEMDRTVMDEMGEALVHLLRNAADHGLEPPEVREQHGKPRRGNIRLSAYASGGHVYLEVADDGGGIHRDGVLTSAIQKGIVDPRKASEMTDSQVYDLLFASGFSTAQTISDISGRGVGLDAVRGKVASLGGDIRIETAVSIGTTFVIELPLTLTILPAMLVRVGTELFALPTGSIEEVARLSPEDVDFVHERPVLKYRDKVVPLLDLGQYFFERSCQENHPWNAVICREGKRYVALTVDDVIDELEVVNKPLGKYLEHAEVFSGATILGDGHVALIVDVHQMFHVSA